MIDRLIYWAFYCGVYSVFFWISATFVSYLIWETIISLFYLADRLHSKTLVAIAFVVSVFFIPLYILRLFAKLFIWASTYISRKRAEEWKRQNLLEWAKETQDIKSKTVLDLPKKSTMPGLYVTIVIVVAYISFFTLWHFFEYNKPDFSKIEVVSSVDTKIVQQQQNNSTSDEVSAVVYVTDSGSKYHKANCQYLSKSKKSIDLSKAKTQGYEPCSKCY